MTSEQDFAKKLDLTPSDWQTRMVFADWLEEHGDPRAAGIRELGRRRIFPLFLPEDFYVPKGRSFLATRATNNNDLARKKKHCNIPDAWFGAVLTRLHGSSVMAEYNIYDDKPDYSYWYWWVRFTTRAGLEDALALAYTEIPEGSLPLPEIRLRERKPGRRDAGSRGRT